MPRRIKIGTDEDRAEFVARLNETIRSFGSVNGLANASGVSEGALRKWAQGTSEPTRDRLVAIAQTAGVNVAWLATGGGPKDRSGQAETPLLEGFVTLQRVESQGGYQGKSDFTLAFSTDWLQSRAEPSGTNLEMIQVPDDSMAPLLPAGSSLVVDSSGGTIKRDGIYALNMDGALLVRRLQRMPGGQIEASSESPTYQSFRFQQDDPAVTVIGRVIWVGHDM